MCIEVIRKRGRSVSAIGETVSTHALSLEEEVLTTGFGNKYGLWFEDKRKWSKQLARLSLYWIDSSSWFSWFF